MPTDAPPPQIPIAAHVHALDGWRGLAVILVFCVHASGNAARFAFGLEFEGANITDMTSWSHRLLFWLFRSHHGVFLFFVLSGFLIGRMWWPRPALRYRDFAWRRTLRIYPAFLLSFVASLAFAHGSGTWIPPDLFLVTGNLLFLNGWPRSPVTAFNAVTWSLFYEMSFYLAFPVLVLLALHATPRHAWWVPAAGIALPLLAVAFGADTLVLCWALLFGGVALAQGASLQWSLARLPTAGVLALYFAITTSALFDLLPPWAAIAAFGCVAVALLAKCLAPGNLIANGLAWPPLVALGRVSYSFYLLHWMIVVLVARGLTTHAAGWNPWLATAALFGGGFALSFAAAKASWWLTERPYFLWVRHSASRT